MKNSMNTSVLLLAAASAAVVGTFAASSAWGQATPSSRIISRIIRDVRTPISSLPFTIDECGSYFVTEITKEKPLKVNYRIWLQKGLMTPEQVAQKSWAFVEPIKVTVK